MKVLVACEESQEVCKAFRALGHEAYSCDLQACSGGHPEWHIQGDVLSHLNDGWDMMIGFPPCTYLTYAGMAHWNNPGRVWARLDGLRFFASLWDAPIEKICLENPKSCASPVIAKYSQEIQPYYFGDGQLKTTWLWLKNLPELKYPIDRPRDLFCEGVNAFAKPEPVLIHERRPSKNYKGGEIKKRYFVDGLPGRNGKLRSKTFPGIARAMAEQWGGNILKQQVA